MTSLIYLIKHGPEKGYSSRAKITDFLIRQKPQYSANQVNLTWDKIVKSKKWNSYLSKLE